MNIDKMIDKLDKMQENGYFKQDDYITVKEEIAIQLWNRRFSDAKAGV